MTRKLMSGAIAACLALAILANMEGGKDLKGVDLGAAVNALNESLDFAELAALLVDERKDLIEVGAPGMPIWKSNAMSAVSNDAGITAELA